MYFHWQNCEVNEMSEESRSVGHSLWIAVRFLIFGVGGFVVVCMSWLSLLFMFDADRLLSPYVGVPLGIIGALFMLFGSGKWGRWLYLWVFLSMPITVLILSVITHNSPNSQFLDSLWAKPLTLIWFSAPMPLSYALVRRHYRRKEARLMAAKPMPS